MLTTTGDPRPLHPEVEVTLLRTAQEALANVAKHARASRVGLTLSYMDDLVTLDVRDDGVGFDPTSSAPTVRRTAASAWPRMRQRVQRLAGTLEIESEPGAGTAISASVPAIPRRRTADDASCSDRSALLIVDDHPVVRDGLRGMFAGDPRFEVVGEAGRRRGGDRGRPSGCRRTWC